MSQVSEHAVKLTADIAQFQKNMDAAAKKLSMTQKQAATFSKQMERSLSSANPAAQKLGQQMAALQSQYQAQIKKFQEFGNAVSDAGKHLEELNKTHAAQQEQIKTTEASVQELTKKYNEALAVQNNMKAAMEAGTKVKVDVYQRVIQDVKNAKAALEEMTTELNGQKAQLDSTEQQMSSWSNAAKLSAQNAANMADNIAETKAQMLGMGRSSVDLTKIGSFFAGMGSKAASLAKQMASLAKSGLQAVVKKFGEAAKSAREFHQQSNIIGKAVTRLSSSFNSFGALLLRRFKRQLISEIFSGLKTGINNVAKESAAFNAAMSGMGSSLKTFANQLGAAFAPLVQICAPIITNFVNLLTKGMNTISAFTARITGADTYKKALPVAYDYAASLDSTAKSANKTATATDKAKKSAEAYKKTILSFDQLHVLNGEDNSSSDTSTITTPETSAASTTPAFTDEKIGGNVKSIADKLAEAFKAHDWDKLGSLMASGVNKAFEWIKNTASWENCGKKITEILNGVTQTFNAFIAGLNPELIGSAIGEVINTIINSILLLQTGIDWVALGTFFGESFKSIFTTVDFNALGQMLMGGIQTVLDLIYGFVTTPGLFESIGTAIKDTFAGMISTFDPTKYGETLAALVNGFFVMAAEAFSDVEKWAELGTKLASNINQFFTDLNPEDIAAGINAFCTAVLTFAGSLISGLEWDTIGAKIGEALSMIDWLSVLGVVGIILTPMLLTKLPALVTMAFQNLGSLLPGIMAAQISIPLVAGLVALGALIIFYITTHWEQIKAWWAGAAAEFNTAFTGLQNIVLGVFGTIKDFVWGVVGSVVELYQQHLEPLINSVVKGVGEIVQTFLAMWNKHIQPVLEKLQKKFDVVVNKHLLPLIQSILKGIGLICDILKTVWETWLKPLAEWIIQTVIPILAPIFETFGTVVLDAFQIAIDIVKGLIDTLNDILSFINDVFKGDWESAFDDVSSIAERIWNGITGIISGPVDLAKSLIDGAVDGIKDALNFFGLDISIENALSGVQNALTAPFTAAQNIIGGAIGEIQKLASSVGGFFDSVGNFIFGGGSNSINLTGYATGGFPEDGLFMANHHELVGSFNGKPAVVNNGQIIQGVSNGVADAIAPFMMEILTAMAKEKTGGTPIIEIDGERMARVVMRNWNNIQNREYATIR